MAHVTPSVAPVILHVSGFRAGHLEIGRLVVPLLAAPPASQISLSKTKLLSDACMNVRQHFCIDIVLV